MIHLPNMLMAGAAGRNLGKTELLCRLIREQGAVHPVTGIKITLLEDESKPYRQINAPFHVVRDEPGADQKDTHRMYAAGAANVYWLRAHREALAEGITALLKQMTCDGIDLQTTCLVCESASARKHIEPGLFLIVNDPEVAMKPSVQQTLPWADRCLNPTNLDISVRFSEGHWHLEEEATAIILSGGSSRRMGSDKGLLQLNGKALIQRQVDQLAPNVKQLLISGSAEKYGFTGQPCIPDRIPDQGPLMGLACALEASEHDLNVVTTCDIPLLNLPFIRRMLREIGPADGLIAVAPNGREQPLFAAYHRRIRPILENALATHQRAVFKVLDPLKIATLPIEGDWYANLNTPESVENYRKHYDLI